MKIHYISEQMTFYSSCGKYHPYPNTTILSEVTCKACLKKLGVSEKPDTIRIKEMEEKVERMQKEINDLKKAMREIMFTCLENLHK